MISKRHSFPPFFGDAKHRASFFGSGFSSPIISLYILLPSPLCSLLSHFCYYSLLILLFFQFDGVLFTQLLLPLLGLSPRPLAMWSPNFFLFVAALTIYHPSSGKCFQNFLPQPPPPLEGYVTFYNSYTVYALTLLVPTFTWDILY